MFNPIERMLLDFCSYQKIIRKDPEVTPAVISVYETVVELSKKTGYCFASKEYLAEYSGLKVDTIRKALKKLVQLKYLEKYKDKVSGLIQYCHVIVTKNHPRYKVVYNHWANKVFPDDPICENFTCENHVFNRKSASDTSKNGMDMPKIKSKGTTGCRKNGMDMPEKRHENPGKFDYQTKAAWPCHFSPANKEVLYKALQNSFKNCSSVSSSPSSSKTREVENSEKFLKSDTGACTSPKESSNSKDLSKASSVKSMTAVGSSKKSGKIKAQNSTLLEKAQKRTFKKRKIKKHSLPKNHLDSTGNRESLSKKDYARTAKEANTAKKAKNCRRTQLKNSFESQRESIPKKQKPKIDLKASHFIDFWNSKNFTTHRKGTKFYNSLISDIKKLMRGKLIPEFKEKVDFDRFGEFVENFELAAFDPAYKPVNGFKERLKKASLKDFLYNPFLKGEIKSYMVAFALTPEPSLATKVWDDDMHKALRKVWLASQGLEEDYTLPIYEEDKLVKAANWLAGFRNQYGHKLEAYDAKINDEKIARYFVQAAFDVFEDTQKWDAGYLASQKMQSNFPRWLTKHCKWSTGRAGAQPVGYRAPTRVRKPELIYTEGTDNIVGVAEYEDNPDDPDMTYLRDLPSMEYLENVFLRMYGEGYNDQEDIQDILERCRKVVRESLEYKNSDEWEEDY